MIFLEMYNSEDRRKEELISKIIGQQEQIAKQEEQLKEEQGSKNLNEQQ